MQRTLIITRATDRAYHDLDLEGEAGAGSAREGRSGRKKLRNRRTPLATLGTAGRRRKLRAKLLEPSSSSRSSPTEAAGMVRYILLQAVENGVRGRHQELRNGLEGAEDGAADGSCSRAVGLRCLRPPGGSKVGASAPAVSSPRRKRSRAAPTARGLAQQLDQALERSASRTSTRLFPRFVQTSASTGTTPAERKAVIALRPGASSESPDQRICRQRRAPEARSRTALSTPPAKSRRRSPAWRSPAHEFSFTSLERRYQGHPDKIAIRSQMLSSTPFPPTTCTDRRLRRR